MRMEIITSRCTRERLAELAAENYGTMIKGVVDVGRSVLVLGGELHADGEALLLVGGSAQDDLWGFNLHMGKDKDARLEFTAFINIRPRQGNRSLEVADPGLRQRMRAIVDALVE
ncbi:MAG TPA: hypothetical protein DCM87_04695 [Planctomycetes bacterium]|nr:hypothetical protein [Planctomycetota bacterium]